MRCEVVVSARYPSLAIEMVAIRASEREHLQFDVPPGLLNALQKAQRDLSKAEDVVLAHLRQSEQVEPDSAVSAMISMRLRAKRPRPDSATATVTP